MDMFMNQGDKKIKNPPRFQFQTLFRYLISRNRPVLALKAAFVFFVVVPWCLRMVDFSGFSISFSSFNLGRTHMFLLCNGIVFILVKGSVLSTPHEGVAANHHMKQEMMNVEKVVVEFEVIKENDHVNSDEIVFGIEEEEEDEKTSNGCVLIAETQPVDQQLVEEEDGMMEAEEFSVEELNKKCDEFIKKMRQVLCNRH